MSHNSHGASMKDMKKRMSTVFQTIITVSPDGMCSLWQVILLYWSVKKLKQIASFASNKIIITMKAVLMLRLLEFGVLYWQERWGNGCGIVKNYVWQETWRSVTDVMLFSPCFSHKCSTLPLPTHPRCVNGFWWYTLYCYCGWTYIHTCSININIKLNKSNGWIH